MNHMPTSLQSLARCMLLSVVVLALTTVAAAAAELSVGDWKVHQKDQLAYVFEARVVSDMAGPVEYRVNFGDETSESGTVIVDGEAYVYAQHTYSANGNYSAGIILDPNSLIQEANRSDNSSTINGVITNAPVQITFTFPAQSFFNGSEQCWYKNCWYDKTLSFTKDWFEFNAATSAPVAGCTAELTEQKNPFTQNDFSLPMANQSGGTNWYVKFSSLPDGLYNLRVVCTDTSGVKSIKSSWYTNNPNVNSYYPETSYEELDTSMILIQKNASQIEELRAYKAIATETSSNLQANMEIGITFILKGFKYYDLLYDGTHRYHGWFIDLRISSTAAISNSTEFNDAAGVYLPDDCYSAPVDAERIRWTCVVGGMNLKEKPGWYLPIEEQKTYHFGSRLLNDAGYAFYDSTDQISHTQEWNVMQASQFKMVLEPKNPYHNVGHLTRMMGGMQGYTTFTITNTDRNEAQYKAVLMNPILQEETFYYYRVQPGEEIIQVRPFIVDPYPCKGLSVSCIDLGVRNERFWVTVSANMNYTGTVYSYLQAQFSGAYNNYSYTLKDQIVITYVPEPYNGWYDLMKVRTDVYSKKIGLSWFKYNIEWQVDPSNPYGTEGNVGTLELVGTNTSAEDGVTPYYGKPWSDYYCGTANCYIPLTEGGAGHYTYRHYWNFRSTWCGPDNIMGQDYTIYRFTIRAINPENEDDQVVLTITQEDTC